MGLLVGMCVVDAEQTVGLCVLVLLWGCLVTVSPVPHLPAGCWLWCGVVWVGQALGLLVPVGWALLLYTSGLSTHCSGGGLNPSWGWETLS